MVQSIEELLWGPRRRKRRKYTRKQMQGSKKWKRELKRKGVTYTRLPKRRRRVRYMEPVPGMRIPVRKKKKSPFDLV